MALKYSKLYQEIDKNLYHIDASRNQVESLVESLLESQDSKM